MRPANATWPATLSNRIAGVRSSGAAVVTTPTLTAAGVLLLGTRVVGPTTVLFACSAAVYAPFRKSAGAAICALTLRVALVRLLFETTTVTDPLVGSSTGVTKLICTGLR